MPDARPVALFAFANDRGADGRYLRNLPAEARCVEAALAPAAALCEVVLRYNVTADQLFNLLQDYRGRLAVLHYAGHADGTALALETRDGTPHLVGAAGLAAFIREQGGLPLAFLNGCSTRPQVDALLAAGVSAVVATSRAIDDATATGFADRFYRGLAGGAPLGVAFREASAAARAGGRGVYRNLTPADAPERDEWPWSLSTHPGAPDAEEWSLPEAAGDPLFGLPALPPLDRPETPFRHLRPFAREHAAVFFGRGRETRTLYHRLTDPGGAPVVLLYGQAGAGKSSLLDAGLLPRLEEKYEVRYARRREGGLLDTLKLLLLPEGADRTPAEAWRAKEAAADRPLVVILDQVEEAYTRAGRPEELDALLDALVPLFADPGSRPRGRLVLGFRKEWLPEVKKKLAERRLPPAGVFLERFDKAGAAEAVGLSAEVRGWFNLTVEPGLAGRIADDLLEDPNSPVAPTLQVLMVSLWDAATARNGGAPVIDGGLYDDLKRRGVLLSDFLDRQLTALAATAPDVVKSGLALDVLAFHTTPLGTAGQRGEHELLKTYAHRADAVKELVRRCKDLYLLADWREDQARHDPPTQLAHDTLAPLVRKRYDESDAPGQRARRLLDNRSPEWRDGDGSSLDEVDLAVVEAGAAGTRGCTVAEERLVAASRRRRDIWRRWLLAAKVTAAAAVFVIAGLAVWGAVLNAGLKRTNTDLVNAKDELEGTNAHLVTAHKAIGEQNEKLDKARVGLEAEERRVRHTASAGLAVVSDRSLDDDPQLALLLAAEAVKLVKDGEARVRAADSALLSALTRVGGRGFVGPRGSGAAPVVSPGGRWLVQGGPGAACVWDLRAADPPATRRELVGEGQPVRAVKVSDDDRWLLTVESVGSGTRTAVLWSLEPDRPAVRVALPPLRADVSRHGAPDDLFFTAGDRGLFGVTADGVARVWDLRDPRPDAPPVADDKRAVRVVAVSRNRRWAALADGDVIDFQDVPRFRPAPLGRSNPADGQPVEQLAAAFSPDGRWLAVSGHWFGPDANVEGGTTLWRLTDGDPEKVPLPPGIERFALDGDNAPAVVFSPGERTRWLLARDVKGGGPRLWPIGDDGSVGMALRLASEPNTSWTATTFAFCPDASRLAASDAGEARVGVYQLPAGPVPKDAPPLAARIVPVAGAGDGLLLRSLTVEFLAPGGGRFITRYGKPPGAAEPTAQSYRAQVWLENADGTIGRDPIHALDPVRSQPTYAGVWPLPDGGLVTADYDGLLTRWAAGTNPQPTPLAAYPTNPAWGGRVAPAGDWLVTSGKERALLWDLRPGSAGRDAAAALGGHPRAVGLARFLPTGRLVTWGDGADGPRLWDLTDPRGPAVPVGPPRVRACAVSPDGAWVVSHVEDRPPAAAGPSSLTVWVTPPGRAAVPLRWTGADPPTLRYAAVSPSGRVALGLTTGLALYDAAAENVAGSRVLLDPGGVNRLGFSPAGDRLAAVGEDGGISMWDVPAAGAPTRLPVRLTLPDAPTAGAFSPDGARLLAVDGAGNVGVWEVPSGRRLGGVDGGKDAKGNAIPAAAMLTPDGRLVTARNGEGVRVRPLGGSAPELAFELPPDADINRMAHLKVSPDGRWLVLAWPDRDGFLWNLAAGGGPPLRLPLHPGLGTPVVFSPSSGWRGAGGRAARPCVGLAGGGGEPGAGRVGGGPRQQLDRGPRLVRRRRRAGGVRRGARPPLAAAARRDAGGGGPARRPTVHRRGVGPLLPRPAVPLDVRRPPGRGPHRAVTDRRAGAGVARRLRQRARRVDARRGGR